MTQLMRFPEARPPHDPDVEAWFATGDELRRLAQPWYERLRTRGGDVRELMHDFCPTACVADAAFAYVNAFTGHVNIGFFQGASLDDPHGLLQGTGKRMRHVKLRWGEAVDSEALSFLIDAAYLDMRGRVSRDE